LYGYLPSRSFDTVTEEYTFLPSGGAETHDGADFLQGRSGDDVLLVGTTDNAIGSAGNDQFIMDIPSDGNSAAAIEDFDPNEDVLSILHDEQKDGALHITVTDSGHDDALVTVDGQTLVIIKGGAGSFTTANIQVEAGVQVAAQ
jgi:hypothetical protein